MTTARRLATHRANRRKPELGKYLLYLHFAKDAKIRKYLPETSRYSVNTLKNYMNRFTSVYVKPSGGSRGQGVLKVWKSDRAVFVQHTNRPPRKFPGVDAAARFVDRQRAGRAYVVQHGIALARVQGSPFDIRVMMQKEVPGGKWLYSGMAAKVAGKGSVVTNVALSHGRVIPVAVALRQSFGWSEERIKRCIDEMVSLGLRVARHFDTYQPYREIGLDVAVDTSGRVWLIEENTAPSHPLFKKMTDDLVPYRRIQYRWGRYQRGLHKRTTSSQKVHK
ncbi:YheC/YheD family protein [Alicyclobacillus sp. ALC3]|uniref:YheC/YheD family protein n=1 Tax=Alicyclobacillus sp. ALC3 TaxID=2796143 RepID=UPI0023784CF1|nr:YheC/YheD family protein [Alicyclobacillus sp. ALC3]WDL96237.1 YheC/YheD family protein [Alicyclobacillus sp. ALC3]